MLRVHFTAVTWLGCGETAAAMSDQRSITLPPTAETSRGPVGHQTLKNGGEVGRLTSVAPYDGGTPLAWRAGLTISVLPSTSG